MAVDFLLLFLCILIFIESLLSASVFTGPFALQSTNFTAIYFPLSSCYKHSYQTLQKKSQQRACYFSDELPWNCIFPGDLFVTNKLPTFLGNGLYYNVSLLCISPLYEISVLPFFIVDYDKNIFHPEWIELVSPTEGIITLSSILIITLYGHHIQPVNDYMRIAPVTQSGNSFTAIPFQSTIQFSLDVDCLGTLIFEVTPFIGGKDGRKGITTHFYFEVVLHATEAVTARSYFNPLVSLEVPKTLAEHFQYRLTTPWSLGLSSCLAISSDINNKSYNSKNANITNRTLSDSPSLDGVHIMYVSGGVFDGQLKIFVDQWHGLAAMRVRLSLLWVCGIDADCIVDNVMLKLLDDYPFVTLVKLPIITVQKHLLSQRPNDSSQSFFDTYNVSFDEITQDIIYSYVVERLKIVEYRLHLVQPPWVHELWRNWLDVVSPVAPDILVIGNTATPSDVIAPCLGRASGARAFVLELASSVSPPHPLLEYSITVAPSHYAHCSFQSNMAPIYASAAASAAAAATCSRGDFEEGDGSNNIVGDSGYECPRNPNTVPPGFIIPPGINLTYFDYYLLDHPPECVDLCNYSHLSSASTSAFLPSNDTPALFTALSPSRTSIDARITSSPATAAATATRAVRCSEDCLIVGFVGRLVAVKGCGMFLLAAELTSKAFSNVRFMVVGSGPLRPYLEEMSARLRISDRVRFLGQATHPRIISLYAAMDVMVSLSQNRMETFMIVNIEAMAAGVPIVSFGTYGQGESLTPPDTPVEEANALIVLNATPEAVATALSLLLANTTLRHTVGSNGRRTVERMFSVDTMLSGYTQAYREALKLASEGSGSRLQ